MPSGYATRATRPTGISLTEQTTNDAITFMEEQISAGKRHLTVVAYNLAHPVPPSDILSYGEAVISCGGTPMATKLENQRFVVECLDSEIQRFLKGTPDLEHTLVVLMGDSAQDRRGSF